MDRKLWAEARAIAARHDPERGEDLAQELAVTLLESGGAARHAPAWLERVARNAAIDTWRVESRRAHLLPRLDADAPAADPEATLIDRERRRLVRGAVAALPRPQRRAALARFHADLSSEEAAARAGVAPATARTRLHRALAALRGRLAALRAFFYLPGVQVSALGVAFLGAQAPPARPVPLVAVDEARAERGARSPHFAHARVLVAEAAIPARHEKPGPVRRGAPSTAATADPPPVQELSFENDTIEGELAGPDSFFVRGLPELAQPSLIELRRHFIPEMLETLEDL
ncbi:MAG TPA: RNA polymerase sigma factor [Polyangia bacterium]|nr:RNA polymerase sigma factor [Polyangia bacterium]